MLANALLLQKSITNEAFEIMGGDAPRRFIVDLVAAGESEVESLARVAASTLSAYEAGRATRRDLFEVFVK